MKINELKKYLIIWGVPKNTYTLEDEEYPEDRVTIYNNLQTYEVYYSERGLKIDKMEFEQEADACMAFLRLLMKSSRAVKKSKIKNIDFGIDKVTVQYQDGDELKASTIT